MDLPPPAPAAPPAPVVLEVSGMLALTVRFTSEPGAWPETWTAEEIRAATEEIYRSDPSALLDLAAPLLVSLTTRVVQQ